MYDSLYRNLRPRSVTPNESSFSKIGHVEQGSKQFLIEFYKVLATVDSPSISYMASIELK